MKLALLTLSLAATAQAKHSAEHCALDGASAVDSLANAAVNIWAATERCDKDNKKASQLRCAVDVMAAAQSVTDMSNIVVHAAKECGAIDHASKCGIEVGHFLAEVAGLGSSIGTIIDSCPGPNNPAGKNTALLSSTTILGKCIIDASTALKGVFGIMQGVTHLKGHEHKEAKAAAVLTDFGSWVAKSVDDCTAYTGHHGNEDAECAGAVLSMVSALDRMGAVGDVMSHKCHAHASRLYLEEPEPKAVSGSSVSVALACFLPITAILGFLVGNRFAKTRAEQARLMEVQEDIE